MDRLLHVIGVPKPVSMRRRILHIQIPFIQATALAHGSYPLKRDVFMLAHTEKRGKNCIRQALTR
jgi:hypothetical protein